MQLAKLALKWSLVLLLVKVTIQIVLNYAGYIPPDFGTDFLHGRESQFNIPYAFAFYVHIVSSPTTIITGLILLNGRFRRCFPATHRVMGRLQVFVVLFLVVPSGIWMARHSFGGPIASLGFTSLAIATAVCAAMGFRSARQRKFDLHQRWMTRCFLLLCSAIVLRLFAGLSGFTYLDSEGSYRAASWLSWLIPIGFYELLTRIGRMSFIQTATEYDSPRLLHRTTPLL